MLHLRWIIKLCEGASMIAAHEGEEPRLYNDANGGPVSGKAFTEPGNITIGRGTNLEGGLSKKSIDFLFFEKLYTLHEELQYTTWFQKLNAPRKWAILDMAYHMGLGSKDSGRGVYSFRKMITALESEDWSAAFVESLDSEWGRDERFFNRTRKIARILFRGDYL